MFSWVRLRSSYGGRKMRSICLWALAVLLVGCGSKSGTGVSFTVADDSSALTSNGGDALFTLTLTVASKAYAASSIQVATAATGQTLMVTNFTHNDTNGDGN